MQQLLKIVRGLSSPAILIAAVWCVTLIAVAVGPIDYPSQPSLTVLALVAAGVSLFVAGHQAGAWCFRSWLRGLKNLPAPPARIANMVVATTSLVGVTGIALIAFDRVVLSGISNGGYAELLRCAPELADFIEIKRTPLLYVGYLTFSFGLASLALFLLKGEEITGWPAVLAQLSILAPVGYAVLYSGRMPIVFVVVLIVAAVLVRISQGRRPLPPGRHLLIKMIVVVFLFIAYSSAMWSSRQKFCIQMTGLIRELQERMQARDLERAPQNRPSARVQQGSGPTGPPWSVDSISGTDLSKLLDFNRTSPGAGSREHSPDVGALLAAMRESWHVRPREYVLSAIETGRLSPNAVKSLLSTYFYFSHGVRVLDLTWHSRAQFHPLWGVYEVGLLSPILRVFFPANQLLSSMNTQLRSAEIYGFFPTVWAAAYIDFGATGAVIYILIWGFAGGWSSFGARRSALATPAMLLTFILASILLSPIQGPLGIANSAMVLISMVFTGIAIDFESLRVGSRQARRDAEAGTPA